MTTRPRSIRLRTLTASTRYRTDQLRRDAQAAAIDLVSQQARLQEAKDKSAKLEQRVKAIQDQQLAAASKIADNKQKIAALVARQAKAKNKLDAKIAGLVKEAERRAAAREARQNQGVAEVAAAAAQRQRPLQLADHRTGHPGVRLHRASPSSRPAAAVHTSTRASTSPTPRARPSARPVTAWSHSWAGTRTTAHDPAFIIVIGHSGGLETYYAHMEPRYLVRSGQFVKQGQLIGYMGATGNATGPHLHWEVRVHGHDTNPRAYV